MEEDLAEEGAVEDEVSRKVKVLRIYLRQFVILLLAQNAWKYDEADMTPEAVNSLSGIMNDLLAESEQIDFTGFFTDPALQSLEVYHLN